MGKQVEAGNIDLTRRPRVQNPDGSVSTIRSIGIEEDGKEVVIPTVIGGKVVSDKDAVAYYRKTGQHLGKFDDVASANAFAQALHEKEASGAGSKPSDEERASGVPDGWEVIQGGKASEPAPAAASARPSVSARAGVPAAGRGTQLDLGRSQAGAEWAVTPLGHPTGVDAVDQFTSPVGLASLAAGGAGIAASGTAGGAAGAARATAGVLAPIAKYEVVKAGLTSMGVPHLLAASAAALVTGYKRGAAPAAAEAEEAAAAASGAHLDRSVPVQAGSLTPAQLRERIVQGSGTPPPRVTSTAPPRPSPTPAPAAAAPVEAPVPPPAPAAAVPAPAPSTAPAAAAEAAPAAAASFSPQKALNEIAIAARRGKVPQLSDREYQQALDMVRAGSAPAEAVAAVAEARQAGLTGEAAAKAFAEKYGLKTPTPAETRFPKGNRGGTANRKP